MKIRLGFVSNSSSTSFVVIGFDIGNEIDDKKMFLTFCDDYTLEELNGMDEDEFDDIFCDFKYSGEFAYLSGTDDGVKSGQTIIGLEIARSSNYSIDSSQKNVLDLIEQVKDIQNKLGIGTEEEIKIYTGTRMC